MICFDKIKKTYKWGEICTCNSPICTDPFPHTHKFKSIIPKNSVCGNYVNNKLCLHKNFSSLIQEYQVKFGDFPIKDRRCFYFIIELAFCNKCNCMNKFISFCDSYKFRKAEMASICHARSDYAMAVIEFNNI